MIVSAGSRLRCFRQTAELRGIAASRIGAADRLDKGIELFKICLRLENMSAL